MKSITKIYGSTGDAISKFENSGWEVSNINSEEFTATKNGLSVNYVEGDISYNETMGTPELPKDMLDTMPGVNAKGAKIIRAMTKIVKTCSYAKINGKLVDLYTASAVTQVFSAMDNVNKKMFLEFDLEKMVSVAFSVIKN